MQTRLRIHAFVDRSRANGPGERAVVWVQGCTLGCPGCFNPETHDPGKGGATDVVELAARIASLADAGVDGLTLSGGEPLEQADAVGALIRGVRQRTDMSILLLTGFSWEEVEGDPERRRVANEADIVVAGRYSAPQRHRRSLIGSTNQTLHFPTGRFTQADLADVPEGEILIGTDGSVVSTGIDPLRMKSRSP